MVLSLYEIQAARDKCSNELNALLNACNVEYEPEKLSDNLYCRELALKVDNYITLKMRAEDILDALSKLLIMAEVEDPNSLSIPEMVSNIVENETKILNKFT